MYLVLFKLNVLKFCWMYKKINTLHFSLYLKEREYDVGYIILHSTLILVLN